MKKFVKKVIDEKVNIPVYMIAYTHLKNKVEVTNFYNDKYDTPEEVEKAIADYTFKFAMIDALCAFPASVIGVLIILPLNFFTEFT